MPASKQQNQSIWISLGILACTFIAYYWIRSAGFIWDDDDYVTSNPVIRDLAGLWRIWFEPSSLPQYYPLVHTTFWIEYQLWELNPFGYHFNNVLLHGLNSVLLYQLLRKLAVPGALFAALIFALHPVHVESVAWITERKNVLSALFYFLSLHAYLLWKPLDDSKAGKTLFGILAFGAFILALLSKTVTFSLPAVILLLVYWKKGSIKRADFLPTIPFFAIGILGGFMTTFLEASHVKASGPEFDLGFLERFLIAGRAVWFYLGKIFAPFPLIFNYPRWEINAASLLQWSFPIALIALLFGLFHFRNRIGRAPLVAMLFFCGSLFPALGFINVYPMRYSFVADHFQYIASIGPIVLAVGAAWTWLQSRLKKPLLIGLFTLDVLVLGFLTFKQVKIYEGLESLWTDTLEKNPESWLAMNNLAKVYMDKGETQRPMELLNRSIEVNLSDESYLNMGVLHYQMGKTDLALKQFNRAIELKPDEAAPHNNKAYILLAEGKLKKALENADKAIELQPEYADGFATRGLILHKMKRWKEASADLQQAIEYNPNKTDLYFFAGDAALRAKQLPEGMKFSQLALLQYPNESRNHDLFASALVQNILKQPAASRADFGKGIYREVGATGNAAFKTVIEYLNGNGEAELAAQLRRELGL